MVGSDRLNVPAIDNSSHATLTFNLLTVVNPTVTNQGFDGGFWG